MGGSARTRAPRGVGIVFEKDGVEDEWSWIEDDHRGSSVRVELLGAVHFLSCLETPSRVFLHSDCEFVVHAIARLHRPNGRKIRADPALVRELRQLVHRHSIDVAWRPIGQCPEIRRADELATTACRGVGKKPVSRKPVQQHPHAPAGSVFPGTRKKKRSFDPLRNPVVSDNLLLWGI